MCSKIVTTGRSSASAQGNTATLAEMFAPGAIIQPERDRIGNYLEELGRMQLRIPNDWLKLIQTAASTLTYERWKRGRWVSCRLAPRNRYRVVKTNYGYRLQHSVLARSYWHVLGEELAEIPLLFPTLESAIAAAEVLIQIEPLKRPELWRLTWQKPWCGMQAICASPTDSK
jgi:hypothetical protein